MKWFITLLLLTNMLVFAYFKLHEPLPQPTPPEHAALRADKIKILTPEQVALLPQKAAPPPPAPAPAANACYEWGSFSAANLVRARAALKKLALEAELKPAAPQDATRYWIYIPPLASPDKAQAKINEVRALGVTDAFIMQDPQWRNAISLGVFKDETLATKLLDELHARGVKSAIKGARNHDGVQATLFLKDIADSLAAEIAKLKPDFPGSELKTVACQ